MLELELEAEKKEQEEEVGPPTGGELLQQT